LTNLGNSYSALGAFAEGLSSHEQALDIYKQLEDDDGCADSYCNLGIAHEALGVGGHPELTLRSHGESSQLKEAAQCYTQALTLYTEIGNRRGETLCNFNLGSTHLCSGNTEEAELLMQSSLLLSRELELNDLAARSLSAMARASIQRGLPEQALEQSARAIVLLGDQVLPEADEIHFTHFSALMANARLDEAPPYLELAHRSVVERAKTIKDNALRASFLSAYQEILTTWEKHQPPSPDT
jgi:tetratricopeptide (TPR) repeat protein